MIKYRTLLWRYGHNAPTPVHTLQISGTTGPPLPLRQHTAHPRPTPVPVGQQLQGILAACAAVADDTDAASDHSSAASDGILEDDDDAAAPAVARHRLTQGLRASFICTHGHHTGFSGRAASVFLDTDDYGFVASGLAGIGITSLNHRNWFPQGSAVSFSHPCSGGSPTDGHPSRWPPPVCRNLAPSWKWPLGPFDLL